MVNSSIDISFAYAQLGLKVGAPLEDIQEVLANTVAYRYATNDRVELVRRLVGFFLARRQFGDLSQSHADIKKFYHRKAMDLHPDRNKGSTATEEKLKQVNAAYRLIDEIYREAKNYYKQTESYRQELEEVARQATNRERSDGGKGAEGHFAAPPERRAPTPPPAQSAKTRKYMAASVPRFLRQSRLAYLPTSCIIGSRLVKGNAGANLYYDIVMLPEPEFVRMKSNVGLQHVIAPSPKMGASFSPTFVLSDTKRVIIPAEEPYPEKIARDYFRKEFKLSDSL